MSDRNPPQGIEEAPTIRDELSGALTVRESELDKTIRESDVSNRSRFGYGVDWLPRQLSENYRVVKALPASGSEADLFIVENRNLQSFVLKAYRLGIRPKEQVLEILSRAETDHVVKLEAYGEHKGRWWELLEYIEHKNLRALIDEEGPKLPIETIRQILKELNDALTHVHELSLEHRDLKPANVLIRARYPLDLVLADFGITSVMDASNRFTGTAGTIEYEPPEALGSNVQEEDGSIEKVAVITHTRWDYWSLGMMLVEMLIGRHPYSGRSQATIGRRLATQNVDDLVEGIQEDSWKMLCRGLLRRDPLKRWGSEQVCSWLANEQDPRLVVEEEVAPVQQALRTIDFDGCSFSSPETLGLALSKDWSKAESFWKRRFRDLQTWVVDTLGQTERGNALVAIDKSQMGLDQQVFSFIYVLAPQAPICFKNIELSKNSLESLADRWSSGETAAGSVLTSLYEHNILTIAGGLENGQELAAIASNWRKAVADYNTKLQTIENNGASAPALKDDQLITLLAATIPVQPVIDRLRNSAISATTADARKCAWFRELGDAHEASAASLLIIVHVIKEAESGARQERYSKAIADYGKSSRFLLGSALGLVVGIVTSYIPGFIVYWPIVWIWSEKEAVVVAVLWVICCTVYAGMIKEFDVARLIGNAEQDVSDVELKGVLYSFLGLAVIVAVLISSFSKANYEYSSVEREEQQRIEQLSASVWATLKGSKKAQSRFSSRGGDILIHAKGNGTFRKTDNVKFLIEHPDRSVGTCKKTTCILYRGGVDNTIMRGTYTIRLETKYGTLASSKFIVL